jgi:hypothetical protein
MTSLGWKSIRVGKNCACREQVFNDRAISLPPCLPQLPWPTFNLQLFGKGVGLGTIYDRSYSIINQRSKYCLSLHETYAVAC